MGFVGEQESNEPNLLTLCDSVAGTESYSVRDHWNTDPLGSVSVPTLFFNLANKDKKP
jgi:hypothetical protein